MKTLMAVAMMSTLIGCGSQAPGGSDAIGGGGGSGQIFLVGMFVNPSPNQVEIGHTTTFVGWGTWSDGTQGEVNCTWVSSDTSIATIDNDGLAAGLALGTCTVTATSTFTSSVFAVGTLQVVAAPPPAPTITTASMPNGSVGTAYSKQLAYTGGSGTPTWSITVGTLPPGIQLNGTSGLVSGTPTTTGLYNFTVQVSAGGIGTKALSIQINPNTGGAGGVGGGGVVVIANPLPNPQPIQQAP